MMQKLFAIGLFLTTLISCSSSNPLIGTWIVESGQSAKLHYPCKELKFEESKVFCDGIAKEIKYEVKGKKIITYTDNSSEVYEIVEPDTMVVKIERTKGGLYGVGEYNLKFKRQKL